MTPMHIALLAPDQHESFQDLLGELHAHYHAGATPARDVLRTHLREQLLGFESPLQLVVASDADRSVLGLAAIVFVPSLVEPEPPHDRQLQVKELFVRATVRGRGVGRALMTWVARTAVQRGCGRIDWNVRASNPAGIRFYAQLGAHQVDDRLSFRLGSEAMHALAGERGNRAAAPLGNALAGESPLAAARRAGAPAQRLTQGLTQGLALRRADAADALCLSVLAMQVFLDTYATSGIRTAIAREVVSGYAESSFERAIVNPDTCLWVAERDGHLVGFAQVTLGAAHPLAPAGVQAELLRLYVQEPFTGQGVGKALLAHAEHSAARAGATVLWLTPWVHNHRALRFYARRGYQDHGLTWFTFEGESHANRVLARSVADV